MHWMNYYGDLSYSHKNIFFFFKFPAVLPIYYKKVKAYLIVVFQA